MTKSNLEETVDLAVVGAGASGLTAADVCQLSGQSVRLFDKGRGPGGRLSTRRSGSLRFDHGARSLSVQGAEAEAVFSQWMEEGVVERWAPRQREPRAESPKWVGKPGMNAPIKHVAGRHRVSFGSRVAALRQAPDHWVLMADNEVPLCRARRVLVAIPAPQATELLDGTGFTHQSRVAAVNFDPVWVAMFQGPDPAAVGFETMSSQGSVFAAVDAQGSKPGRPSDPAWVAQASVPWSRAHLEEAPEVIEDLLRVELARLFDQAVSGPISVHRWRYARCANPVGEEVLVDQALGLVCCGDWCLGDTVGDAIQSGLAAGRWLTDLSTESSSEGS